MKLIKNACFFVTLQQKGLSTFQFTYYCILQTLIARYFIKVTFQFHAESFYKENNYFVSFNRWSMLTSTTSVRAVTSWARPPETPEPDSPAESSESLNNFGTKKNEILSRKTGFPTQKWKFSGVSSLNIILIKSWSFLVLKVTCSLYSSHSGEWNEIIVFLEIKLRKMILPSVLLYFIAIIYLMEF